MTETDTDLYFLKPKPEYDNFFHADGMKVHYGDFRGLLSEDPYPFLFETRDGTRDSAMSSLVNTFPDLGLRFWWDAPRMGEFYHYQVNKSVAIRHIAKHYGYDRAHTIAFGDAENDIEMLSDAGISFAMKNGSKDLAKVASYVTEEDDDHDGVMVALQHLFGDR
jgi:hydroxymethylpyrimidine pyrophosphatase-like HAD family hydrolase